MSSSPCFLWLSRSQRALAVAEKSWHAAQVDRHVLGSLHGHSELRASRRGIPRLVSLPLWRPATLYSCSIVITSRRGLGPSWQISRRVSGGDAEHRDLHQSRLCRCSRRWLCSAARGDFAVPVTRTLRRRWTVHMELSLSHSRSGGGSGLPPQSVPGSSRGVVGR